MRLAILLFLSAASASAGIILTVSPLLQTAPVGATATVQIGISGLGLHTAPSVGAYDLNLAFNPFILSFTGVTFGDPMQGDQLNLTASGPISDFDSSLPGTVEFFEISLDPTAVLNTQQSDHFVLATLSFQAMAPGNTSLLPTINSIADAAGSPLSATLQPASITVAAVPEPSPFAMLLLLPAFLAWRRYRLAPRPGLMLLTQSFTAAE